MSFAPQWRRASLSRRKLTPVDVSRVREALREGSSLRTIADDFGVSRETVRRIKHGITYQGGTP